MSYGVMRHNYYSSLQLATADNINITLSPLFFSFEHTHTHQIHPIFMLSIADSLLALLWTTGGSLWLYNGVTTSQDAERVGCFTVLLMTVVSCLLN